MSTTDNSFGAPEGVTVSEVVVSYGEQDMRAMRWQVQQEHDREDRELSEGVALDIIAMLRTGTILPKFKQAKIRQATGYSEDYLIEVGGETYALSLKRKVERDTDAEAIARLQAGERPAKGFYY